MSTLDGYSPENTMRRVLEREAKRLSKDLANKAKELALQNALRSGSYIYVESISFRMHDLKFAERRQTVLTAVLESAREAMERNVPGELWDAGEWRLQESRGPRDGFEESLRFIGRFPTYYKHHPPKNLREPLAPPPPTPPPPGTFIDDLT